MKSGICPKCGSDDVYSGEGVTFKKGYSYSNTIPTGGFGLFQRSMFAMLDNYVCGYCGYVESYIANEKDLRKITDKWPRADGRKKKRDEP